jgi:rubrerythrin
MVEGKFDLAGIIARNNQDEWAAIEGYYEMLEILTEMGEDQADIDQIKEIISDEKNHSDMLTKMALKYDSGIVEAED